MEYKIYLDYTIELLSQIKIPSYIIDTPYIWDNQIDGGLRNNIFTQNANMNNQENFSKFISSYNRDNTALFIHDSFSCEYIHIKLPDSTRVFIAGPFSYERFTNQRIHDLCSYNSVPVQYNEFMQLYYSALWGNNYTIEKKHILNKNSTQYMYKEEAPEPTKKSIEVLESHYKNEAFLMECIAHGDYRSIESMEHLNSANIKPRLSDSIRDRKNFMIILNTICRKAAQTAYIHPVHLDEISRKFAIKIEDCTSIAQLEVLENEMTRKYCLLVQSYSLRAYSKPIQNIINYISFNLTADLSLNALSEEFMLNSSYLSTLFKKETGVTLTNFVNNKRIEHAIYLLNTTQSAIQDIAAQCGINDVNYFTKLFKKLKNMTPTQYREMIQHK